MKPVFADTFFFLAIINPKDRAHRIAIEFSSNRKEPILTTEWVLTELADGLDRTQDRHLFHLVLQDLTDSPDDLIVAANHELFDRGANLYSSRPDKQWSLTDCLSFVVMEQFGIKDALTGDQHFEQAGFVALLK